MRLQPILLGALLFYSCAKIQENTFENQVQGTWLCESVQSKGLFNQNNNTLDHLIGDTFYLYEDESFELQTSQGEFCNGNWYIDHQIQQWAIDEELTSYSVPHLVIGSNCFTRTLQLGRIKKDKLSLFTTRNSNIEIKLARL